MTGCGNADTAWFTRELEIAGVLAVDRDGYSLAGYDYSYLSGRKDPPLETDWTLPFPTTSATETALYIDITPVC